MRPTLELCSQIKTEADFLLHGSELGVGLLIGSVNLDRQIDGLRKDKPRIAAGNPGRLLLMARWASSRLGALAWTGFRL